MSKTISITIPDQLERDLRKKAETIGISRSRFIGNILLDWQKKKIQPPNNCQNLNNGWCRVFQFCCSAPQHEAEICSDFVSSVKEEK